MTNTFLLLNSDKTEILLIGPKNSTRNLLDYNLLGGCPASSINKLQIVQNAVARVLTRSRKYDHITPILQSLHWLPIKFCIRYKILLLAYKAINDLAPAYLTNLLSRYNPFPKVAKLWTLGST